MRGTSVACSIPTSSHRTSHALIAAAGWVGSVVVAIVATCSALAASGLAVPVDGVDDEGSAGRRHLLVAVASGTWWAALDSVTSDLFGVGVDDDAGTRGGGGCNFSGGAVMRELRTFHCGNFGLILLSSEHRDKVATIIRTMIQVVRSTAKRSPLPFSFSFPPSSLRPALPPPPSPHSDL